MKYENIDVAIQAYIDYMIEDYGRFSQNKDMFEEFKNSFRVDPGRKYIKIISGGSCRAFIVKKDDGVYKAGDLLKPASWAAPAKHARGNVIEGKFSGGWTGPAYLK